MIIRIITLLFFIENVLSECLINPDSEGSWPEWPPIITDFVGDFILPTGTDNDRSISIPTDQVVYLSCGSEGEFDHSYEWKDGPVYARCMGNDNFDVWTDGNQDAVSLGFGDLGCRAQPVDSLETGKSCGPYNQGTIINIGFDTNSNVEGVETVTITVCFDTITSTNIWSRHSLWDEISARDHGNDSPFFNPDDFFDYDVNHFYTMNQQRETIGEIVRNQSLADEYVQDFESEIYLARGHLAPNADFIFYSWMDSTYHFVNVAPQWQAFNGGNWMYFENGLRDFVEERKMDLVVYTGTHGVCQLEDTDGNMVDIFLYLPDRLPVPKFYWKIVFDPVKNAGVAVIGVNNIHLKSLPSDYILCPPISDHPILDNVYHPENLSRGFMWACRVEDLAAAVPNVPDLPQMDLLM